MKKNVSLLIALVVLVSSSFVWGDSNEYLDFDEYGFRMNPKQEISRQLFSVGTVEWETFPSKSNVPLDKMWTIEFSRTIDINEIDAVVIEQGTQYIPVTISKTVDNKLVVSPRDEFAGNTNYVLKVLLNNGKRYKMDFRTRNSNREADIEPNNTYLEASKVYLNEVINGEITKGDVDFFKVEIPSHGTLNLNLTGFNNVGMSLYLYGPNGNNESYMESKTNFTQGGISEGLRPGTYYIKVTTRYDSDYSPYELEINFDESQFKDDNGVSNYLYSELVDLNGSFTGHVGYFSDYNRGNYNDFFKVEIPSHGTLNLNLTGFNNVGMSLYLYGPNGNNDSYMESKTNFTQGGISEGLRPGTYYIKVTTRYDSDYSPYELEINFDESNFEDDNGVSNYLYSELVDLNGSFTGHVGYFSGYNRGNYNDFFKIEIPREGTLDINLTGFNNVGMSLYLYGPNGDNEYAMKSKTNFTKGGISASLTPGTYYIKVTTHYDSSYSPYELELEFD